ncbi:MAG: hypothetical protein Q9207_000853 [Kuettlingeria erythrocarpa]
MWWQNLFGYSEVEAEEQIKAHRFDLNRQKISDEAWQLIQAGKEAKGYDREAYEHMLHLYTMDASQPFVSHDTDTFVFKLGGPLDCEETLCSAIGYPVRVMQGRSEGGLEGAGTSFMHAPLKEASFAKVDGATKKKIEQWLWSKDGCSYRPNFVRLSMAKKDLSNDSLHPTLGIDSTLPHYRAPHQREAAMQSQYPVWYFFYGTLGQADLLRLQDLLDLDFLPEM